MNNCIGLLQSRFYKRDINMFMTGYLVDVQTWIQEGDKKRKQSFIGVIISIKKKGIFSSLIVRKTSYGIGVEKFFVINSPIIYKIIILKKYYLRQSKLYYLRKPLNKHLRMYYKKI